MVIIAVVTTNCLIGAYQEFKAERALAGLQAMSAPNARVRRGGEAYKIPAREVVPGDVVLVRAGDLVPVDGRLLSAALLQVDESPLTGESVAVEKDPDLVFPVNTALPDRVNMLFHGTSVTFGHGRLLATATGGHSEVGQLARSVSEAVERATPLEHQVSWLAKVLSLLAIAASGVVLALGLLRGQPLTEMLLVAVSLAVAAVPSGLPAVVTIVLALGVQGPAAAPSCAASQAVEALGAATVICTTRPGRSPSARCGRPALSGGQLLDIRDARLWQDGQPVDLGTVPGLHDLLRAVALCNNAHLEPVPIGDPTERALLRFSRDLGADRASLEASWPRVAELPFSSDQKCIDFKWTGECVRGADVEGSGTSATVFRLPFVGSDFQCGEDRAEEQPGAVKPRNQIVCLPCQPMPAASASGFSITGAVSTNTFTSTPNWPAIWLAKRLSFFLMTS